jgi:hypothetical protein
MSFHTYLNEFIEAGCKPNYVHIHARNIRTFAKFLLEENYITRPIKFTMPPVGKERLPVLTADEVNRVYLACQTPRDKDVFAFYRYRSETE